MLFKIRGPTMKKLLLLLILCFGNRASCDEDYMLHRPLKMLHLTFHQGCSNEIAAMAECLGIDVTTWFIPSLPPGWLDGTSAGNSLFSICNDRAARIWNLHKEEFESYDVILTSDTAPLARIFLQNNCQKPLIIWICNRFDYYDKAGCDCSFPDNDFYRYMSEARHRKNVRVIAYSLFEHYYAHSKGVDTGDLIINPCAPIIKQNKQMTHCIPVEEKRNKFFIPNYLNEKQFMNFSAVCNDMGIPNHRSWYNGPDDLIDFKAILPLPCAYCNIGMFENLARGIPYFVPSASFLHRLMTSGGMYWHHDKSPLIHEHKFWLSEWYTPERNGIMIYYDSWADLVHKVQTIDLEAQRQKILTWADEHRDKMLTKWKEVFESFEDLDLN